MLSRTTADEMVAATGPRGPTAAPATLTRQSTGPAQLAGLWRPVLSGDDAPDHLTLPTLEQPIDPRARAAAANTESRPAAEDRWTNEATLHDDVPTPLTRCLTQVWCAPGPS